MQMERQSSIDSEPRTLNLDRAREAALHVIKTKTPEEAIAIFTEGLKPVVSGKHKGEPAVDPDDHEEWDYSLPHSSKNAPTHPTIKGQRDVVSAPF